MIYITGDTHGEIDFSYVKEYFAKRYATEKDVLIILGDASPFWGIDDDNIDDYSSLGPTVIYLDGNHENFTLLSMFPVVERFGAKCHMISPNVYHVMRGEILTINELTFLCMGGATSVDKDYRKKGTSWWSEEHITSSDLNNALANLKKFNGEVDYVLTHAAPTSTVSRCLHFKGDADTKSLEILKEHVSFTHWYFGHYHDDRTFRRGYRLFYHDIIVIKKNKKPIRERFLHYYYLSSEDGEKHLRKGDGKLTRLLAEDLPEYFFPNFNGHHTDFFSLKGVKYIAFSPSPFDNQINKDAQIYLSYDSPIQIDKNGYRADEHMCRVPLLDFIKGLELYSPSLKLLPIKALINLNYDRYIASSANQLSGREMRPYPDVETPVLEGTLFAAKVNGLTLCTFKKEEEGKAYVDSYNRIRNKGSSIYTATPNDGSMEEGRDGQTNIHDVAYLAPCTPDGKNPQGNSEYDLEQATKYWKFGY